MISLHLYRRFREPLSFCFLQYLLNIQAFWGVTLRRMVNFYRHFGEEWCFKIESQAVQKWPRSLKTLKNRCGKRTNSQTCKIFKVTHSEAHKI